MQILITDAVFCKRVSTNIIYKMYVPLLHLFISTLNMKQKKIFTLINLSFSNLITFVDLTSSKILCPLQVLMEEQN